MPPGRRPRGCGLRPPGSRSALQCLPGGSSGVSGRSPDIWEPDGAIDPGRGCGCPPGTARRARGRAIVPHVRSPRAGSPQGRRRRRWPGGGYRPSGRVPAALNTWSSERRSVSSAEGPVPRPAPAVADAELGDELSDEITRMGRVVRRAVPQGRLIDARVVGWFVVLRTGRESPLGCRACAGDHGSRGTSRPCPQRPHP